MPSNLPTTTNTGQLNACLFRVARLAADCSPLGGNNSGYVTAGLASITPTPDVEEGTVFEPKNGCGAIMYTYENPDRVKRFNLSGELLFFDFEAMELMFGGSVILGASGGDFAGEVIGYAHPNYDDAPNNGVYLEVISQVVGEGAGDCVTSEGGFPTYVGTIFGKTRLTIGEVTREENVARLTFTGKARSNPALFDGPFNDWVGEGYIPNSPMIQIGYSDAEYQAILATAAAGYQDLPAAS